jgi:lysophospholipase L1-like esterase
MVHQALSKLIMPIIGIPPKIDLDNIRKDWAMFTDFNKIAIELVKYQSWIMDFSKTFNIKYIDFYSEIDNIAKTSNLYLDGLHLNDNGQIMMSKLFCDAIKKLNI